MKKATEYLIQVEKFLIKYVLMVFSFGALLILLTPALLTLRCGLGRFNETGAIGDTIGGITSPFIGILSALLVYVAFKAQMDANAITKEQFETINRKEQAQKLVSKLNDQLNFLSLEINNFQYTDKRTALVRSDRIDYDEFSEGEVSGVTFYGGRAISEVVRFVSSPHYKHYGLRYIGQDLYSLLLEVSSFLDLLDDPDLPSADALNFKRRIQYLFFAKIHPPFHVGTSRVRPCSECGIEHGNIPIDLFSVYRNVYKRIGMTVYEWHQSNAEEE